MQELGKLEAYPVREVWPDEAKAFTPWLADPQNLPLLGEAVGLSLTPLGIEQAVGPFYADIVCTASGPDGQERRIVIENQFGRSDHAHLGQLLTYAAGVDAYAAIWIAEHFTDEHRAAIDWLNEGSESDREFWALEIEVWLIGDSRPAPRFNVVAAPNPVTKAAGGDPVELSDVRRDRLEFWQGFLQFIEEQGEALTLRKPRPETVLFHSVGKGGIGLNFIYSDYDLAEQRYVGQDGQVVTRVELVLFGASAFERFDALKRSQSEIEAQLSESSLVWYEEAAKERKVFSQRLWSHGDEFERDALYAWLLAEVRRFEPVFMGRL
jgi:hypothetical protein